MTALLLVALAAAPTPGAKLAAVSLAPVDVSPERAEVYLEHLSVALRAQGFEVTTPKDVATVLGLERQRQLLGCADSACLAELAGALGVDSVLNGQVVRTPQAFRLALKIVSAAKGDVRFACAETADSEDGLYLALERCAQRAAASLLGVQQVKSTVPVVVAIVGGLASLVGVVFAGRAAASYELIERRGEAALLFEALGPIVAQGKLEQGLALGFLGAGALGLVGGLVWYALAPTYPAKVTLDVRQGGALLGLEAAW